MNFKVIDRRLVLELLQHIAAPFMSLELPYNPAVMINIYSVMQFHTVRFVQASTDHPRLLRSCLFGMSVNN